MNQHFRFQSLAFLALAAFAFGAANNAHGQSATQNALGDIYVHGSSADDDLGITFPFSPTVPGFVRITLNGVEQHFDHVRNITASLYGGDDVLRMGGIQLPGNFLFNGGDGDDVVALQAEDMNFGGNVLIDLGIGNNRMFSYSFLSRCVINVAGDYNLLCGGGDDEVDFRTVTKLAVQGETTIRMGGGDNFLILGRPGTRSATARQSEFAKGLRFESGDGIDELELHDFENSNFFQVTMGNGLNTLECGNCSLDEYTSYVGGDSVDTLDFDFAEVQGIFNIETKESKDFIEMLLCSVNAETSIGTGPGNEIIEFTMSDLSGSFRLNTGPDKDEVHVLRSDVTADFRVQMMHGQDKFTFIESTFSGPGMDIEMGSGFDTIRLAESSFENEFKLKLGIGDDVVETESNTFYGIPSFYIWGSNGFDRLEETGTHSIRPNPEIFGVELVIGY